MLIIQDMLVDLSKQQQVMHQKDKLLKSWIANRRCTALFFTGHVF